MSPVRSAANGSSMRPTRTDPSPPLRIDSTTIFLATNEVFDPRPFSPIDRLPPPACAAADAGKSLTVSPALKNAIMCSSSIPLPSSSMTMFHSSPPALVKDTWMFHAVRVHAVGERFAKQLDRTARVHNGLAKDRCLHDLRPMGSHACGLLRRLASSTGPLWPVFAQRTGPAHAARRRPEAGGPAGGPCSRSFRLCSNLRRRPGVPKWRARTGRHDWLRRHHGRSNGRPNGRPNRRPNRRPTSSGRRDGGHCPSCAGTALAAGRALPESSLSMNSMSRPPSSQPPKDSESDGIKPAQVTFAYRIRPSSGGSPIAGLTVTNTWSINSTALFQSRKPTGLSPARSLSSSPSLVQRPECGPPTTRRSQAIAPCAAAAAQARARGACTRVRTTRSGLPAPGHGLLAPSRRERSPQSFNCQTRP